MTVSSPTNRVSYDGNGVTTTFAVPFRFLADGDVRAVLRTAAGTEVEWAETTDYTLAGAGDPAGGTLTALAPPAAGETLVILRAVPLTQETDYVEGEPFPAATHERALDKLTMIVQQHEEALARAPRRKVTSAPVDLVLPDPEPGKPLGWTEDDRLGNLASLGRWRGEWAADAEYLAADIVREPASRNLYRARASHRAAGSFAADLAAGRWEVLIDVGAVETARAAAEAAALDADADAVSAAADRAGAEAARAAAEAARDATIEVPGASPILAAGTPVARRLDQHLGDVANVRNFGAIGDGRSHPLSERFATLAEAQAVYPHATALTDEIDWAAIQGAVDSGGFVFVPRGKYWLNRTLTVTKGVRFFGIGSESRLILVANATGDTDVVRVAPGVAGGLLFLEFRDFSMFPEVGTPGRHGIHFDLSADPGIYVQKLLITGVQIGNTVNYFGGNAISLTTHVLATDAFFTNSIRRNILSGGINLPGAGDSVWIEENVITGPNVGIYIEPFGGSEIVIRNNSITATGGCIYLKSSSRATIEDNQMELLAPWTGGSERALVVLEDCVSCRVLSNNINPDLGASDGADCIRIVGATKDTKIDGNRLTCNAMDGWFHIKIPITATYNAIFSNNYYENPFLTEVDDIVVDDASHTTVGVWKELTLQNGWTGATTGGSTYEGLFYRMNEDRSVSLRGNIAGGENTAGTTIATLPLGPRPRKTLRAPVPYLDGSTWGMWVLLINPNGIINVPAQVFPSVVAVTCDNIVFHR